jgi:hypothetical protein
MLASIRPLLIAAGVIVIIQAALGYGIYLLIPEWSMRGQFGDLFGAVNALFSGLAFAGLIYTALLQREELSLQRKELILTRDELRRTALSQEQSEKALRAQAAATEQSTQLAATNFLLEYYRVELTRLKGQAYLTNDPRVEHLRVLQERERMLLGILDGVYERLTNERATI